MGMFIQIIGLVAIVGAAIYFFVKSNKTEKSLPKQSSVSKKEKTESEELENSRV